MKKLFSVLLALSMIFLISACDKKEEETVAGSGVLINKFEEAFAGEGSTIKFTEKEIDGGYEYSFEQYGDIYVCRANKDKNVYSVKVTISTVNIDTLKDSKSLRRLTESDRYGSYTLLMLNTVACPGKVAQISVAIGGNILTDATVDEFYQIFDGSGKELKLNDEWTVTVSLDEQKEEVTIVAEWHE